MQSRRHHPQVGDGDDVLPVVVAVDPHVGPCSSFAVETYSRSFPRTVQSSRCVGWLRLETLIDLVCEVEKQR